MSYTESILSYVYDQYCLSYNIEDTIDYIEDELDFTREQIKEMIQYNIQEHQERFIKYYESLVKKFDSKFKYHQINCKDERIEWPKESGVYVVWVSTDNSFDNLIYVGMTGKFKRVNQNEVIFNSGSFHKRNYRWTPYRFCESVKDGKNQFSFRYVPLKKKTNDQGKIKYQEDAYKVTLPYTKLKIDCFLITQFDMDHTPDLLEKEILTKYLKSSGNLPPANNEL